MTHNHAGGRRAAFTLLEILVVMTCLTLMLLLIAAILRETLQIQERSLRDSNQLVARSALADRFRSDVARAKDVPKKRGELVAGPNCLLLRTADDKEIVYRWVKEEGAAGRSRLERTETAGAATKAQALPVGEETVAVEFARSAAGRVVSLRLIEVRGKGREKHVSEFDAALGGDLR